MMARLVDENQRAPSQTSHRDVKPIGTVTARVCAVERTRHTDRGVHDREELSKDIMRRGKREGKRLQSGTPCPRRSAVRRVTT